MGKNCLKFMLLGLLCLGLPALSHAQEAGAEAAGDAQQRPLSDGSTASFLAAQFARSTGDIVQAIHYLRQVHKAQPDNVEIARQLQALLLLDGRVDEATAIAGAVVKQDDKDAVSVLLLALSQIKKNNAAKAASILDEAFASTSGQLWLPLISAWLDISEHRLTKPLTVEGLSANVGRAAGLVNYHLALINSYAGFYEPAADNFKHSVEDPKNAPGRIMAAMKQFNVAHPDADLAAIIKDYDEANPGSDMRGEAPVIAKPQAGVAEVLLTMGSLMQGGGVVQDAIIYLQLAAYMQPSLATAQVALGNSYSDLGKLEKANEIYAKVTADSGAYMPAQLRMAFNYNKLGKFAEAMTVLEKLSQKMAGSYEPLVAKADILRQHKHFEQSVAQYGKALERIGAQEKPQHWSIYFARGTAYERMSRWPQAEKDMLHALELAPEQADVLNYLGYSWLMRGENLEQAHVMISKAAQARPDDPQIMDSMGWSYFYQGDYEKAVQYLEKAVALLPGDATINDHLGDAYWRLGRKVEARFQWERALGFAADETLAEAIRKKLKDGMAPKVIVNRAQPQPEPQPLAATMRDKPVATE